jgi:predicted phage terminase large subunit-like protein
MEWKFPSNATIEFSHLQHDKNIADHLSKQYALIIFDQLEQFEAHHFWQLFGRNRSVCGKSPYTRAACNPDPDCFLYENGEGLIAWWIGEDGYPIEERSGVLRWFVRDTDDSLIWGNSAAEVRRKAPHICKKEPDAPTSITFIGAKLEDNPALNEADPKYRGKLMMLPRIERERKLHGNWKVKASAGMYFQRSYFEIIDEAPKDVAETVRGWDEAATKPSQANPDPDWTVGVRYSRLKDGSFCVEHVERLRESPLGVERALKNTAQADGKKVRVGLWQDPGSAGKSHAQHLVRLLNGFTVKVEVASKDKETYAGPVSSQAEAGNIKIVRGPWNDAFLSCLESFPDGAHKDDVDALSRSHRMVSNSNLERLRRLATR